MGNHSCLDPNKNLERQIKLHDSGPINRFFALSAHCNYNVLFHPMGERAQQLNQLTTIYDKNY